MPAPSTPLPKPSKARKPLHQRKTSWGSIPMPATVLDSLVTLQDLEDNKPKVSKVSWLPDILVYRASVIPLVMEPVLFFTAFSALVAMAALVFEKKVALTNNVVPLLSIVVGLLLVFRNTSAYERYAEGRKDFTAVISNARNLSRLIWINVVPPPGEFTPAQRALLTKRKRQAVRLVVGFVMATKHYLRSEGGVNHADLHGLLPKSLVESIRHSCPDSDDEQDTTPEGSITNSPIMQSPRSYSHPNLPFNTDEERNVGLGHPTQPTATRGKTGSFSFPPSPNGGISIEPRPKPTRRLTAVRVNRPTLEVETKSMLAPSNQGSMKGSVNERTPLIKSGVRMDAGHGTGSDGGKAAAATASFGGMVEVGLPLVIAHEITRTLFRFRRQGNLEVIGPAGFNAMQTLVQSMVDQLGSMERIIQTPLPYPMIAFLKQSVTIYLLCLPFVLVEVMGWKMIWIIMIISFTLCGIEAIAVQIEQPFGTDATDLNLDLFCTELLCECEAILERLPEGDVDDEAIFVRSDTQMRLDEQDGD